MRKTQNHIIHTNTKVLFWIISALIIFSMSVYIYFVNSAILYAAKRKNAIESYTKIQSEIGDMESEYIKSQDKIDKEYAKMRGFVNIEETYFASRNAVPKFSLNEN